MPLMTMTGRAVEGAKIDATASFPAQLQALFAQWKVGDTGRSITQAVEDSPGRLVELARRCLDFPRAHSRAIS